MSRKTAEERSEKYDAAKFPKADYYGTYVNITTKRSKDQLRKVIKGVEGTGNNPATRLTHGLSLLSKYQEF